VRAAGRCGRRALFSPYSQAKRGALTATPTRGAGIWRGYFIGESFDSCGRAGSTCLTATQQPAPPPGAPLGPRRRRCACEATAACRTRRWRHRYHISGLYSEDDRGTLPPSPPGDHTLAWAVVLLFLLWRGLPRRLMPCASSRGTRPRREGAGVSPCLPRRPPSQARQPGAAARPTRGHEVRRYNDNCR